jgi:NAD(P)-dependent dehydrogenase (short-subunit alcohol dehydrogenase family)
VTDRWGRLDVLVNNAGIGDTHLPTLDQTIDSFDRILRIHLTGTFMASREAARVMISQGGGAIVNISSIAGITGLPRRNAYGAAKAGIVSLTRSMACEWAGNGIRVNAIAPGYVGTELVHRLEQAGKIDMDRLKRRIPMGRLAKPEEIADTAWFLASPQASYITGTVVSVDGGWHAFGDAGDASAEPASMASDHD